jgi:DNA mismatch endonuclease (patch repair protein)
MADVFDSAKRSEVMSRIRGKGNKTTEVALASAFRKAGITGWRRHLALKVKLASKRGASTGAESLILIVRPDFVFRRERVAVFVDGCFWHQCPLHARVPVNNSEFWSEKLRRNVERDRAANRALRAAGWKVVRVWEHELSTTYRPSINMMKLLSARD